MFLTEALGVDKIYVINLRRRPDRLRLMHIKLRRAGFLPDDYTIFEAVDGRDAECQRLYRAYLRWYATLGMSREVIDVSDRARAYNFVNSLGALGLLLTYRRLCREIRDRKYRRVLVLEDDACLMQNFERSVAKSIPESVREELRAYDVLRLGANQNLWEHCHVEHGYYDVPGHKYHWALGTFAIVLGESIVEALLQVLEDTPPARYPATVDFLIWKLVQDRTLLDAALFPNPAIADVTESDNMDARTMESIATRCRWRLEQYELCGVGAAMKQFHRAAQSTSLVQHAHALEARGAAALHLKSCANDSSLDFDDVLHVVQGDDRAFVFIVPSFNNIEWAERNIGSICMQTYPHWRAIYVDDCSTDGTLERAQELVDRFGASDRFIFLTNETRRYQAFSRYAAYNHASCRMDEIGVLLDGDDWLHHGRVLQVLNAKYRAHDLRVSYGQFFYFDNGQIQSMSGIDEYPDDVTRRSAYREHPRWIAQHLRTAEVSLLKQIPENYLKHQGEWIRCCTDIAEMMLLLELSNGKHMNIGEPLVVYNRQNSKQHANSYYNVDKSAHEKEYRESMLKKYLRRGAPTNEVRHATHLAEG